MGFQGCHFSSDLVVLNECRAVQFECVYVLSLCMRVWLYCCKMLGLIYLYFRGCVEINIRGSGLLCWCRVVENNRWFGSLCLSGIVVKFANIGSDCVSGKERF